MPPKKRASTATTTTTRATAASESTPTAKRLRSSSAAKSSTAEPAVATAAAPAARGKRASTKTAATSTATATIAAPAKSASRSRKPSSTHVVVPSYTDAACEAWFNSYTDDSDDTIDITGIERFCNDVGISIEGQTLLVIAWKLRAERMGYFSKSEWIKGMRELKVDSAEKMKQQLGVLESVLRTRDHVKEIYKWAFGFCKESGQRNVNVEMAKGMWKLLFSPPGDGPASVHFNHINTFIDFLEAKEPVKVISKDQWSSLIEFSEQVPQDLKGYDDNTAWPVLFDEYVTWRRETDKDMKE